MMVSVSDEKDRPQAKSGRKRYVVAVLFLVVFLNYLDRQILGILIQPIKEDLLLSDTQLGLITGFAFALFYAVFGIPFARWADVGHRPRIIAISLAAWSIMTALCGAAQNFLSLFIARMGVGVGEAGGTPTAHSLIATTFGKRKRGAAASVLSLAAVFGSFGGVVLAGFIAQHYGWRIAFVAAGLPGMVLAVILWQTVREPRPKPERLRLGDAFGTATLSSCKALLKIQSYRYLALGMVAMLFWQWGIGNWYASYVVRRFELELAEVALRFGITGGLATLLGAIAVGVTNDRLVARAPMWRGLFPTICAIVTGVTGYWIFAAESLNGSLFFLFAAMLASGMALPAVYAAFYEIAGESRRAMSVALANFLNNMIALALGPLVIGLASDYFALQLGESEGLRIASKLASLALVVSTAFFLLATRASRSDNSSIEFGEAR